MQTVLTLLLIRFAIIAAVVTVVAVGLFAVAVHLKRRGKWDAARKRLGPAALEAADLYSRRSGSGTSLTARAAQSAARRLNSDDSENRS